MPTTSNSEKEKIVNIRRLRVLGSVGIVLAGTACLGGPSFEVGDCVTVERRVLDFDLESADCASARMSLDREAIVYRVDSVIDNTDGGCPNLRGFFPVEFVHEPDGVTYCLVAQT